jgi:hypothetical protein
MTAQARKIVVVNASEMKQDTLYSAMLDITPQKLGSMRANVAKIVEERVAFEAVRERKLLDGSVVVQQSNDIRHVEALATSEAFQRMCVALKINPRSYIHPASQKDGKTSDQTSNLKAYKKAREVAELILTGTSTLENVAKVFTVCAYKSVHTSTVTDNVLRRDYAECFLNSPEFRSIREGAQDLFDAIDEIRAKQMTGGGAKTQASQMIRTLVALGSAEDVRNGRSKDVRVNPEGLVMKSLMRRFGQVEELDAATA